MPESVDYTWDTPVDLAQYAKIYGDGGSLRRKWGLPKGYASMSPEDRKAARLKVLRDHSSPERFTRAFDLFCSHFLQRDHTDYAELPRELQFYKRKKPPALIHHMMADWVRRYPFNLCAIPRHFGKSAVMGMAMPLFLSLTKPSGFKILYVINSNSFIKQRFADLMLQLESNPLILEDFGVNKPPRGGDSIWTKNILMLNNRNTIMGMPIGARVLGIHPDWCCIDDAEQDPDDPTSGLKDTDLIAARLDNYIFSTIMPSLDPGCGIFWIGTLISKRHYIYHAAFSKEKKWEFWNRAVYPAIDDATGKELWKHKFDEGAIDKMRYSLGSKFGANVMNRPGMDSDPVFFLDDEFHMYNVMSGPHPKDEIKPLESKSVITYNVITTNSSGDIEPIPMQEHAGHLISNMYRFATVDYARSSHARADFSVVMVMGKDVAKRLWILDLWAGRIGLDRTGTGKGKKLLSEDILIRKAWEMCVKWRTHTLCIESTAIQQYMLARAKSDMEAWMLKANFGLNITGTKYPSQWSKEDRICNALEWRFNNNSILLPAPLRKQWPFNMMFMQIRDMTRDGSRLRHDDCLDTLAMQHFMDGHQSGIKEHVARNRTALDRMKDGEVVDEHGMPLASFLTPDKITPALIDAIVSKRAEQEDEEDDYAPGVNWFGINF